MCLSPWSDDLPIDEASDLWKNLVGEPWALARFSSHPDLISHIVHISLHVAHSSIICCHFLLIWISIEHWSGCNIVILHIVNCTWCIANCTLYVEHFDPCGLWGFWSVVCSIVEMISSTHSTADQIPITLLAANSARPTNGKHKGGLEESMALMSDWCDVKRDKWGPSGGWYKTQRQHPEEQKVNTGSWVEYGGIWQAGDSWFLRRFFFASAAPSPALSVYCLCAQNLFFGAQLWNSKFKLQFWVVSCEGFSKGDLEAQVKAPSLTGCQASWDSTPTSPQGFVWAAQWQPAL